MNRPTGQLPQSQTHSDNHDPNISSPKARVSPKPVLPNFWKELPSELNRAIVEFLDLTSFIALDEAFNFYFRNSGGEWDATLKSKVGNVMPWLVPHNDDQNGGTEAATWWECAERIAQLRAEAADGSVSMPAYLLSLMNFKEIPARVSQVLELEKVDRVPEDADCLRPVICQKRWLDGRFSFGEEKNQPGVKEVWKGKLVHADYSSTDAVVDLATMKCSSYKDLISESARYISTLVKFDKSEEVQGFDNGYGLLFVDHTHSPGDTRLQLMTRKSGTLDTTDTYQFDLRNFDEEYGHGNLHVLPIREGFFITVSHLGMEYTTYYVSFNHKALFKLDKDVPLFEVMEYNGMLWFDPDFGQEGHSRFMVPLILDLERFDMSKQVSDPNLYDTCVYRGNDGYSGDMKFSSALRTREYCWSADRKYRRFARTLKGSSIIDLATGTQYDIDCPQKAAVILGFQKKKLRGWLLTDDRLTALHAQCVKFHDSGTPISEWELQ